MFFHNLKYFLKILSRNRMLIFWTFMFPIILGTFFKLAFADIETNEKLNVSDIAIVDNDEFKNNQILSEVFNRLSDKKYKNQLFNIKYVTLKKAEKLLNDNKIIGYLYLKDKTIIKVKKSGINETIFKYVTDEALKQSVLIKDLIEKRVNDTKLTDEVVDYSKIYQEVSDIVNNTKGNIKDISHPNLSYTMIEFYTLIAMACLYGSIISSTAINKVLANQSNQGKRVSVSRCKKSTLIISSAIASFIIQTIGILILFLYTIFALKVDYGNNFYLVILLSLFGILAGLSLGIFISTIFKFNENTKTGILLAISMVGSFLSGMMGITMKYVVDTNAFLLNRINPVNMITDGLYSLYYYSTLDRYLFNLISLFIFSFVLILISVVVLRRQKYDSI